MAKGVELASAYVSLSVSTDGIPGQIKKALNGSTKDIEQAGTRIGTSYSNAIGRSATSGMLGHGKSAAAKFGDGFQSDAERRGARIGTAVGTVIGKGIGGAITLKPLLDARALGYQHAALFATEMGIHTYERIGFRLVGTRINRYLWRNG